MIKEKITYLLCMLFIVSCTTYKTFYKTSYKTHTSPENTPVYRVDLSRQTPEIILKKLKRLNHIKSLNLTGVNTEVLHNLFLAVPNPTILHSLILDSMALKTLPKSITRFKNLKQLALNGNPNLNFKQVFTTLKQLPIAFLNLQNNNLKTLPKTISSLSTLNDLNLSGNNITNSDAYTYLSKIPKLYALWLNNNALNNLPESINQLTQLNRLFIENNKLTKLPKSISKMSSLCVFHLGHNAFKTLPEPLSKCPKLLLVHINNCEISSISKTFANKAPFFKGIILDGNPLSEMDKAYWKKEFRHFFLISMD